jgi:hypothetical protein
MDPRCIACMLNAEIAKHKIALKKAWGPPLTALAVQLTCPSCNFEAVYPPADIQLGDIDPDE